MALVQYFVMKRPKHPVTGEIIRGKASGATINPDGSINQGASVWFPATLTAVGANGTLMSTTAPLTSLTIGNGSLPTDNAQIDGEPWILHSVHFSVEDAIKASKPVISTVGSENVNILRSIAHEMKVTLA